MLRTIQTPSSINKIVDLTVENGVTVPEIRMESLPSQDTGNLSVKINNYGTVKLFSTPETVNGQYQGVSYTNHNRHRTDHGSKYNCCADHADLEYRHRNHW